jgi:hypothetical protein
MAYTRSVSPALPGASKETQISIAEVFTRGMKSGITSQIIPLTQPFPIYPCRLYDNKAVYI